jgi:hypothetical protein
MNAFGVFEAVTYNRVSLCKKPSLFPGLVFAVLTIGELKNHK